MAKLWQKGYELDELIEEFTVGRDWELDRRLVGADCFGSAAQGRMLQRVGLLGEAEADALVEGLREILRLDGKGEFEIRREDEDCHTAIENFLTRRCGEAGKKIHTGRSRNDQVLTALRIYGRRALARVMEAGLSLVEKLASFAREHAGVPMPGRTHMQIAMPSSVGLWAGSFAEEILDDLALARGAMELLDRSPLGAAASYGTPLPLDRELSASLMGFASVQNNVLACNNARGKSEAVTVDALEQLMLTYSKLSQDLILFSLPEFGYFSLPAELCSGSSIMPQKKNPDALELMRGKAAALGGWSVWIKGVIRSLPSGYNRDFQETKEPFIRALELALQATLVMERTVEKLEVHADKLTAAFTPDIFATDAAYELVAGGMSFRDAYREVGTNLGAVAGRDPAGAIEDRKSAGSAGNLRLELLNEGVAGLRRELLERTGRWELAARELFGEDAGLV